MSLENVKVGDTLALSRHGGTPTLFKVTAVGKMYVTATRGTTTQQFMIRNGKPKGSDTWTAQYAHPATERDFLEVRRATAVATIRSFADGNQIKEVSVEDLVTIAALIREICTPKDIKQ